MKSSYEIANSYPRMLAVMYRFKSEQGWRRFDLSSPSRKDTNLQVRSPQISSSSRFGLQSYVGPFVWFDFISFSFLPLRCA